MLRIGKGIIRVDVQESVIRALPPSARSAVLEYHIQRTRRRMEAAMQEAARLEAELEDVVRLEAGREEVRAAPIRN